MMESISVAIGIIALLWVFCGAIIALLVILLDKPIDNDDVSQHNRIHTNDD